jgi:hypothetical protein
VSARPVDLRGVLGSLHDHRVDYVLFGSAAMLFYGYIRATEDIDLVVRDSEENLRRVHDWLVSLDAHLALRPARRFGARERWGMLKGSNVTVLTSCGQLDVVQRLPGLPDWDRLAADSELYEREGMRIQVMNRRTLIELKPPPRLAAGPGRHRGDRATGTPGRVDGLPFAQSTLGSACLGF